MTAETVIKAKELPPFRTAVSAAGYRIAWNHCTAKKGYSGTAIIYRKSLGKGVVHVGFNAGAETSKLDREGRCMALELPDIIIVNVYVPNTGGSATDAISRRVDIWDPALRARVKAFAARKPVVLVGDFNAVSDRTLDVNDRFRRDTQSCVRPAEIAGLHKLLSECELHDVWRERNPTAKGFTYGMPANYYNGLGCFMRLECVGARPSRRGDR